MGKPILPRPINPMSILSLSPFVIASEAKQSISPLAALWIASSLSLLAMTLHRRLSGLVHLGKKFACDAETVDGGGHAGIDRDLHQDLADFLAGDAVVERAAQMRAQFVRPVQDRDHGDVEHAAGLARQFVTAPHRAPAILVEQVLEWRVEAVDVFQRVVH